VKKTLCISAEDAGSTALKLLKRHFPDLPLSAIHRLFRKKDFKKNGVRVSEKEILHKGDEVVIFFAEKTEEKKTKKREISAVQKEKELRVLWEDENFVVLNKRSGMPVHSGSGAETGIIDIAQAEWPTAHLAHRLDRETSGALLLAKNGEALRLLLPGISHWKKEYLALVFGKFSGKIGSIRTPLVSREDPTKKQTAVTHFAVEDEFAETTLLKIYLETGRTHQIRRHSSGIKKPLVGDSKYGDFQKNRSFGAPRLFLHAASLEWENPISGKKVSVLAPLPEDLKMVLQTTKKHQAAREAGGEKSSRYSF